MEEVADGLLKVIARGVLAIVRVLIWISWEVLYERVAWYLGWPVARLVSLNQFPKESFTNEEGAHWLTQLIVVMIGIAYPIGLAFFLLHYLGH